MRRDLSSTVRPIDRDDGKMVLLIAIEDGTVLEVHPEGISRMNSDVMVLYSQLWEMLPLAGEHIQA